MANPRVQTLNDAARRIPEDAGDSARASFDVTYFEAQQCMLDLYKQSCRAGAGEDVLNPVFQALYKQLPDGMWGIPRVVKKKDPSL